MTRAAIYVRISSDREGGGLGVERQEADCRELAGQLGWDVVTVHTDNDISAYSGKVRPGYTALLDDLQSGHVNAVLAWHTDRLYRQATDLAPLVDLAKAKGVKIRTVKAGELDLSTPTGVFVAELLASVAKLEVAHSVERMERAHRQRAAAGKIHGGSRPFGWKADRIHKDPGEAAEILRWAIHVLAGGSLGDLVRDLNKRGVATVQGGAWGKQQIRQVLVRPRLSGWRVHRGTTVAKGEWEPILPEDVHRQVIALLTNPARFTGPAIPERRHLLSGLALCAECDTPVIIKTDMPAYKKGDKTKRAYHCRTCRMYRSKDPVDEYVESYVTEWLRHRDAPPGGEPAAADDGRLEFLHAKRRAALALFGASDTVSPADQLVMLSSLDDEIAAELARLTPADTQRHRVLEQADPDEFAGYPISRKRAVIDALCVVRLKRVPAGGGRGFDPESVVITRR